MKETVTDGVRVQEVIDNVVKTVELSGKTWEEDVRQVVKKELIEQIS